MRGQALSTILERAARLLIRRSARGGRLHAAVVLPCLRISSRLKIILFWKDIEAASNELHWRRQETPPQSTHKGVCSMQVAKQTDIERPALKSLLPYRNDEVIAAHFDELAVEAAKRSQSSDDAIPLALPCRERPIAQDHRQSHRYPRRDVACVRPVHAAVPRILVQVFPKKSASHARYHG